MKHVDLGKKQKRHRVISPVSTGETRGLPDLIGKAKAEPKEFIATVEKLIAERGPDGKRKLSIERINLRDVQQGFKDVTIPSFHTDPDGRQRGIMASAFPLLTGLLLVAEIEDAYEQVDTIGDLLVTDFEDSKKVTTIARILTEDTNVDRVEEAQPYPEIKAGEESYDVTSVRNGRKLSITQEMIDQNDVPNIVERVSRLAEIALSFTEELTLSRVSDQYGSAASPAAPYALQLRGATLGALYSTTANTPGVRAPSGTSLAANALVTSANLDAVRKVIANMRDDRNRRLSYKWSDMILLVPDALVGVASKILRSELEPGVLNEYGNWGPRGIYQPTLVSSPKMDDISATTWFFGAFKKQFRRKWTTNFEYVTLGADTQAFLDRRIAFQARIGWDMGVNAVDYNRVVRCTA